MVDPSATQGGKDGRIRMGRRRFLGTGLAAAGAALIPSAAGLKRAGRATAQSAAGHISQLPLRAEFPNLPAVPIETGAIPDTVERLEIREEQVMQAKQGLTQNFTIDGVRRRAYAFLFGGTMPASQTEGWRAFRGTLQDNPGAVPGQIHENLGRRTEGDASAGATGPLSLDRPRQFSISWTNFTNVYENGRPHLRGWAASLTDADAATRRFWPMIARHGFGYNLIIPERVTRARAGDLQQQFGAAWNRRVRRALADGNLYVIDMSRFEALEPSSFNGVPRFTPATVTLLIRNRRTKSLKPVAVIVSGHGGAGRTVYARGSASDGAWLYALQAAKASITVFGVWLGHVYHWHIVTAAMQMAMLNTLPNGHPVRQLLAPQSNYVIPFDNVLLAQWSQLAPPTSLAAPTEFLALANDYAAGRSYFDDDPRTTIKQLGLRRRDFTAKAPWDRYPVVERLLTMWDLVASYVETFVRTTYASDAAVASDADLQTWISTAASSSASSGGNVRGLPEMNSRAALERVLTSLLYRIAIHGISRMNSTSNPALTFVPNFPHCLQRTDIPSPRARIGTRKLLSYLPNTNTISQAVTFYFTFAFSTPYEPFIPLDGAGQQLFFPGGGGDERNQALVDLRKGLGRFIKDYQPDQPQRFQWPLNIET